MLYPTRSVLINVPRVPFCYTCLTCLRVSHAYVLYVVACLTCLPLFMCLTCLSFLRALSVFIVLHALQLITWFQFLTWYGAFMVQQGRISKNEYFVFQNFGIFNIKLVLQKQPLWSLLKVVFRIPWFKSLKNISKYIMC